MTTDIGVVIGRFQVDELTPGHRWLIDSAFRNHKTVLVLIGTNGAVTKKDPLTYPMRQHLVTAVYPEAITAPLADVPGNDAEWSDRLDILVATLFPTAVRVTFYGARDSFAKHYSGRGSKETTPEFNEWSVVELDSGVEWSGSHHRAQLARGLMNSPDFRRGVIYAVMNFT